MNKPAGDGIDHINIYSKGKTSLGRFLSNFSMANVDAGEDGMFRSVEGYWYWLTRKDERLRRAVGYEAKRIGRELSIVARYSNEEFQTKILTAIHNKIQNSAFDKAFKTSTLPFTHYYVYGGKVIEAGHEWIVEGIEEMRRKMKQKSLRFYTAQMAVAAKLSGMYTLDITVKGRHPIGSAFAPTWNIVMGHKEGRITDEQYTEVYWQLMRKSWQNNRGIWNTLLKDTKEVVLLCYCRPGNFCHRLVLANIFEKMGAVNLGEITL